MRNSFSVTGNKEYDFYLQNYENVKSLQEIIKISEVGIPQWLEGEIRDAIRDLHHREFFDDINLTYHECDEPWWSCDKYYDEDKEIGVYFQFESGWALKNVVDVNDPIYLCFAVDASGRNGKYARTSWQKYFYKFKRELRKKNITTYDDDDAYLAVYSLWNLTNIDVIKKQRFSTKPIQEAVKNFTLTLLPIIKKKKP